MITTKTIYISFFFFSSRRRHTRSDRDWSSDVCSSDLAGAVRRPLVRPVRERLRGRGQGRRAAAVRRARGRVGVALRAGGAARGGGGGAPGPRGGGRGPRGRRTPPGVPPGAGRGGPGDGRAVC